MLETLLVILSALSLSVFLLPRHLKVWSAVAVIGVAAVAALVEAVTVFSDVLVSVQTDDFSVVFGDGYSATDPLSALFMLMVSICGISVVVYSKGYLQNQIATKSAQKLSIHYLAMSLLFISLLLVVTQRGGFGFLFAWEMMSISSFVLMLWNAEKAEVRRAALNYLVLMHVGFVALLAGFSMLAAKGLPVTFDSIGEYTQMHNPLVIFIFMLIGFGMKAGLFPLHVWMPSTYSSSNDYVSAFMSGALSKMGLYGIIRVVASMDEGLFSAGVILLVLGAITGVWGVILSTVQSDIKRLLAYSSIENMGIMFLSVGLAAIGISTSNSMLVLCGMGGALLHAMSHSMLKTVLYFASGNVSTQCGTTSIDSLGGVAKRMPVTAALFLVGIIAICALPPLSSFASEFLIYFGLLDTIATNSNTVLGAIFAVITLALIGGLVLLAFSKLYGVVFLGTPRSAVVESATEVDRFRLAAFILPLAGMLVIGLFPALMVEAIFNITSQLLDVKSSYVYLAMISPSLWKISIAIGVLIVVVVALLLYKKLALKHRAQDYSPTWGCGFSETTSRMQYGGESFAEGLHSITPSLTKNTGERDSVSKDEFFPSQHSFNTRHKDKIDTLFEAWWVELIRKINTKVMFMRTGKVNYQVLYALMFLVLILVLSLINII